MSNTIIGTDFTLPGQTSVYHGKVRDVYTINNDLMVMVATDRISAFDIILPRPIPYKGQVLNQVAEHFLKAASDIVPTWLTSVPDPNVSIGRKCEPFKIEMVVRGLMVGHAWRTYSSGGRELCGNDLPEGIQEYDAFELPLITPSTKAETGHDEDITAERIVEQGLATREEFAELSDIARKLFAQGQQMAAKQGLYLADTKYEFGKVGSTIYLIDEIHTPDSSRYFYADSLKTYQDDHTAEHPKQMSKEFVREWLMERGFSGQLGQDVPDMTDEFIDAVSRRYIELYEQITGHAFTKPDDGLPATERIEASIMRSLEQSPGSLAA